MAKYVMLSRISTREFENPRNLEELEKKAMDHVHQECPDVKWLGSYTLLGPYDYLDIFEASTTDEATKVGTLIRSYGHVHTETWAATEWDRFKEMIHHLKAA